MFQNIFSPSSTTWSILVASAILIPLLIHLINLMRHRRVEWAAMEFLLKSYKKNRNWIWLKQLFLLLARMAALLLALFTLARIGCNQDRLSGMLGGNVTHHYVLLDDSFSMSDRGSKGTTFDRARATLSLIAARAKDRQNQKFTLIRYSKASSAIGVSPTIDGPTSNPSEQLLVADINAETIDASFPSRLEDAKAGLSPSNLAVNQNAALNLVAQLIDQRNSERAFVYVLSDFRSKDWNNLADTQRHMESIRDKGGTIELIQCAELERPNLAIIDLQPAGSVRVAGIPLMMELTVKNYSASAATNVRVDVSQLTFDELDEVPNDPDDSSPKVDELPTVFIERIEPQESVTRQFPLMFNTTGYHVTRVSLPDDGVSLDNQFWNVTQYNASAKVLLIDNPQQLHSSFLSLALNPGGMTGIETEVRSKEFLRDSSPQRLATYDVIFLLDQDRLDETAVKSLETYVEQGGGLAIFLGPKTDINFHNESLYRLGKGVLPMALQEPIEIPEQNDERPPDVVPVRHPVFEPMMDSKNSLLELVQIKNIIQPPLEWQAADSNANVIATVRGVKTWPLVLEKSFGAGRCVLFTTTAGPVWNNWMRNGTFPPMLLLLENELAKGKFLSDAKNVGQPFKIQASSGVFVPNVVANLPSTNEARFQFTRPFRESKESKQTIEFLLGETLQDGTTETDIPGYYELWLKRSDSTPEVRRLAFNVDSTEGDLTMANSQAILAELENVNPKWVLWNQVDTRPPSLAATSLTRFLFVLLVAILLVEQILAYSASYHSRVSTVTRTRARLS